MIVIDGRETGVGKSALGIQICRALDSEFGIDHFAFSAREVHVAYDTLPAGSMVLYDESVLGLLSKKGSRDDELAGLIGAISIVRKNGIGTVMCVPKVRMLDTIVYHGLAPYWVFAEDRGRARVHRAHRGVHYRNSQPRIPYDLWPEISPIGWRNLDRDPFFQEYVELAVRRNHDYFREQQRVIDVRRARQLGLPAPAGTLPSTENVPERSQSPPPPPPPPAAPPTCPRCGATFARLDNLVRHQRTACSGASGRS